MAYKGRLACRTAVAERHRLRFRPGPL